MSPEVSRAIDLWNDFYGTPKRHNYQSKDEWVDSVAEAIKDAVEKAARANRGLTMTEVIAQEREACAKVADGYGSMEASDVTVADVIAQAIRERNGK